MDNHKLVMVPLLFEFFSYFFKYNKIQFLFFFYKICMKILEFGYMQTNKNVFSYFLNKDFFIFCISKILKKKMNI